MKRAGFLLLIYILYFLPFLNAQTANKKPITTSDFAAWKVLDNPIISADGKFVALEINPQKGDGNLVVKTIDSKKEDLFARGYAASFSPESDLIVYKIKQPADSIRDAKKKKLKKEQMPKDSIGIFVFKQRKSYKFPNLKQFSIPKESARWVAFLTDMPAGKNKSSKAEETTKNTPKTNKNDDPAEQKSQLVLFNVASGDTVCFQNISEYYYAPLGRSVTFIRQTKDSLNRSEVISFNTETRKTKVIFDRLGTAKKITSDQPGGRIGFIFSADTIKEKTYGLYYGTLASGEAKAVVLPEQPGLPVDWSPSEFGDLSFSDNGQRLYFGTNRKPKVEPENTLLDDEKPLLDIWSWEDKELQPEQKVNLEKEKKRTYKAVYLVDKDKFVQLGNPEVREVKTIQKGNGSIALGSDPSPYKLESSWTGQSNADYYLIDIETGIKRLIVENKSLVSLSPGGNFIVWYDPADSSYYSRSTNISSTKDIQLTKQVQVSFCDEIWDVPDDPNPYGNSRVGGKRQVYFYLRPLRHLED